METREEFIEKFRQRDGHTREEFDAQFIALPCTCEEDEQPIHWARVRKNDAMIECHHQSELLRAGGFSALPLYSHPGS
jgi:hypothetical protein